MLSPDSDCSTAQVKASSSDPHTRRNPPKLNSSSKRFTSSAVWPIKATARVPPAIVSAKPSSGTCLSYPPANSTTGEANEASAISTDSGVVASESL